MKGGMLCAFPPYIFSPYGGTGVLPVQAQAEACGYINNYFYVTLNP